MPKKGRSKSHSRPQAFDDSDEICKKNGWTANQYAQMYHHMQGHAPAPPGRARGSSRAPSNGGRSGHTSRAPSQEPVRERDLFKDAVTMRYNEACDKYRSEKLFEANSYTRDEILAKAYEMQRTGAPHNENVVDALLKSGKADSADSTAAENMFPPRSTQAWTHKVVKRKNLYAKMWIVAMQSMSDSGYEWYKKFSKRELRALLIQQCYDTDQLRHISLQDYVHEHTVAKKEYKLIADNMFQNDSETIQDHVYETRKGGPQYMTPKYMQYRTPNTHHHPGGGAPQHAGDSAPHHARGGALHMEPHTEPRSVMPPTVPNTGMVRQRTRKDPLLTGPLPPAAGSYAHDDFGDEVPDDYRV